MYGRSPQDHRRSHPYSTGTEHVGFSPTMHMSRAYKRGRAGGDLCLSVDTRARPKERGSAGGRWRWEGKGRVQI